MKFQLSLSLMVACLYCPNAQAQSRALDYFLDPPKKGLYAHADAFTAGAQLSLEHRKELDGDLSMLTSRVSALASLGYSEVSAQSEVRVAFLALGLSAGYRDVWRTYQGAPGQLVTIDRRRETDAAKSFGAEAWGWGEARARLIIPLETLWWVSSASLRYEDSPSNTFDWFHTNVHDGGWIGKVDSTLFVRDKSFGAIGPTVRYMDMPRNGQRVDEFAFGLTAGVRVGVKKKTDLLLVQVLTAPKSDEFGFHILNMPVWAFVNYRMTFPLAWDGREN